MIKKAQPGVFLLGFGLNLFVFKCPA